MPKLIENKVLFLSTTVGGYILDIEDLVVRDRKGKEVMEVTLIGRRGQTFVVLPCGFCESEYSEWPLICPDKYRYHKLMCLTGICENCGDIDL